MRGYTGWRLTLQALEIIRAGGEGGDEAAQCIVERYLIYCMFARNGLTYRSILTAIYKDYRTLRNNNGKLAEYTAAPFYLKARAPRIRDACAAWGWRDAAGVGFCDLNDDRKELLQKGNAGFID